MTPVTWPHDLEALETVTQNELAREVFLRMARLSPGAGIGTFLAELVDSGIDAETQEAFAEVACDRVFLQALDDYVHRTRILH